VVFGYDLDVRYSGSQVSSALIHLERDFFSLLGGVASSADTCERRRPMRHGLRLDIAGDGRVRVVSGVTPVARHATSSRCMYQKSERTSKQERISFTMNRKWAKSAVGGASGIPFSIA
jgi:hypothetical protein